ncbi:unnamed protein product [Alopecurus aequalis]
MFMYVQPPPSARSHEMETLGALARGAAAATQASCSSSTQPGASAPPPPPPAPAARKRTPGRWRRIPREMTPARMAAKEAIKAREVLGVVDWEKRDRWYLQKAAELEAIDANDCDSEEAKVAFLAAREQALRLYRKIARTRLEDMKFRPIEFSDTMEEYPTAEEMEVLFAQRKVSHTAQVEHFSMLALAHYNGGKTTHKFELSKALTSNCFSETCGTTYAHVNFTAVPQKSDQNDDTDHATMTKRLFFAELIFVPNLRADEDTEPMDVLHVCTIDDVPSYGGCHEIRRKINHMMRGDMDYERCHACRGILKHPKGNIFIGGHNSTRMPYYSAT